MRELVGDRSGMAAGRQFDYEALAQEAMRGVVRAVLQQVASTGLVGDHHFYIAFNTQGPGVNVSRRLKEKYPVEMTIVLQHRFWDLEVNDERFEVKLTFDGIPERLVVPFKAVKVFYDPSVPYGLQFEESELMGGSRRPGSVRDNEDDVLGDAADNPGMTKASGGRTASPERAEKRRERPAKKPRAENKAEAGPDAEKSQAGAVIPAATKSQPAGKPQIAAVKTEEPPAPDQGGGAKVLDLSKFRKK